MSEIDFNAFREQLNQTFTLGITVDESVPCRLVDIRSLSGYSARSDKSSFSLLFRTAADFVHSQQIMRLENEHVGEMALFLVPVGPDPEDPEKGMLYEAIFT